MSSLFTFILHDFSAKSGKWVYNSCIWERIKFIALCAPDPMRCCYMTNFGHMATFYWLCCTGH